MARLQNPWLGSFIASELDALIKWNESTKKSPQVKSDPDCRFFDDGSNFRCIVGSPPLPADSKVQLLEVISPARDAAVVLLCDGAYSIKATLSEEALANLEEELGEQLSMDVKGDVFLVHSATLISTPYGPEDGHIQLYIDKLQYQYNLRRTPNGLPLVKQHDDVRKLFCQISQIRYQQYAEADNVDCIDSGSPLLDTDMKVTDNLREADCTPVPGLLPSSWLLPDNSQAAVATQIDPSRKRRKMAPSLAKDGFAFETGVNLALPSGTLSSITRQDDMCNALPNLRRLLQNNKCASPSYSRDPNTTTDNIDQRDSGNNQEGRRSSPFISRSSPETPEYLALPHSSLLKTSDRKDMSNFRLQYGRRKPPMSQQRLLNQESSWFPPEAGKQFPVPNVPIELLKIWISEAPIPVSEASRAELSQVGAQPNSTGYEPIVHTGNSDSSSQTSSSEELPWSPSQRKDDYLPPDSTVNSGPRRPEFELQEQRRPSVQSPYRHEQSPNKRDVQHPQLLELQEQFNKSPVRSSTVFSSNSKACPKTKACDSASQMASIARISKVSTISETPIDGSRRSYRESVRTDFPFRSHSTQHHTSTKQFNTNKEMGIGIEGPQISRNDDEMEMDVPRVYRDPARVHRQKRSEYFKHAQRVAWLRTNCVIDSPTEPDIGQVYKAYYKEFPNDDIQPAELENLLRELFPALWNLSRSSLAPKLPGRGRPSSHGVRALSQQFGGNNEANDGRPSDRMKQDPPGRLLKDYNSTYDNNFAHSELGINRPQSSAFVQQFHNANPESSSDAHKIPQCSSSICDISNGTTVPNPEGTSFKEFVTAWTSIKPGGAFVGHHGPRKTRRQYIDVLSWQF